MEQGATVLMFKAAEELRSHARSKSDIAADMARVSVAVTGAIVLLVLAIVLMGGVSIGISSAFQFVSSSLTDR